MANHCEKVFRRTFDKTFKIPTSTVKSASNLISLNYRKIG